MNDLPEPAHRGPDGTGSYFDSFTATQMREYRNQALEEAVESACEAVAFNGGSVQMESHVRQAINELKGEVK